MHQFLSVTEVANLLKMSRAGVLKKIKSGSLSAKKVGNTYVIDKDDLIRVADRDTSESQKAMVEKAAKRVMKEYGETLRLLQDS